VLAQQALLLSEREGRLVPGAQEPGRAQRLRELTDALPEVIWTASSDGRMDHFNHHWYETTGLDEARSLGAGWLRAVHSEDAERVTVAWRKAIESGAPLDLELRLRMAGGDHRWHAARTMVRSAEPDGLPRWFGIFSDIDAQVNAREQARACVRQREEFIGIASHELRTPLTVMELEVENLTLMLRGSAQDLAPRFSQKVTSISRQVARLSRLASKLLDVSLLATGQLKLDRAPLDLAEIVPAVAARWREAAERAGCELRCACDGPLMVSWDCVRLEQLLTNLLANAIKYAPGKPIDVVLARAPDALTLAVSDRGIGIAAEALPRIFERFERGIGSKRDGLGLGLYIAREIAQAHGARLEAASEPGLGSTFTLTFPTPTRAPRAASSSPSTS
jgi:PAS domain S-box-containing protein